MTWLVERLGAVERWTIQGEARRNSLTMALLQDAAGLLERAAADRALRVVVLTGAGGRAFCAGADLKERAAMADAQVADFHRALRALLDGLEALPQVVVAALNGAALGGGLELALACDLRVAAEGALMGLPEVGLGIIPGGGGTQRLPRLIGAGRALDLILTGRRVGAAEALAMGLVTAVAPAARLGEEALALARRVAANAPVSLRQAKRAVAEGRHLPLAEALDLEHRLYQACLPTQDRQEALRAFAEKRPPVFTGE
ncbi:MAG: enoyl-CoA hydratase/isomerase family protein [Anaeromyxobacter sp.]|nr:enoyl-CoA hydratase/isomerase family protein [Anaeromyxobacter sp.]